MKKLLFVTTLLIAMHLKLCAQEYMCSYQNKETLAPSGSSENGFAHSPNGNLHIMFLFVTFIEDDNTPGTDALSANWPKNGVPIYTSANGSPNAFIDAFPLNPTTQNNLTNWFKTMSKIPNTNTNPPTGKFSITGEVFQVQISKDTANIPDNHLNPSRLDEIEATFCQRAKAALQVKYPNENWSRFDKRHNNPIFAFDNSLQNSGNPANTPAIGDGVIDYLNICFRLPKSFIDPLGKRAGQARHDLFSDPYKAPLSPIINAFGTFSFNVGHTLLYELDYHKHFQYFLHEFSHNLFNSNHYMGANSAAGVHFYQHNGWGMMGGEARSFLTANAWEKWYLGWFEPQTITTSGIYYLKDFVNETDAIRIYIPAISPNNTEWYTHQYLWIENHQMTNHFDNKFIYTTEAPMQQGIYAYISDWDAKSGESVYNGQNRFKVLNATGRWDYTHQIAGDFIEAQQIQENPIGGQSNSEFIRADYNTDSEIPYAAEGSQGNESRYIAKLNNTNKAYWTMTGDDGFRVNDEIGLSGTVPVTSYPNFSEFEIGLRYGVDPYQISGISIKILEYNSATKTYKLDINLNDYELRNNKRWSANGINLNNLSNDNNPDLIIKTGVELLINKSRTVNRSTKGTNNEYADFIRPTVFTCKANSYLKMESNSTIIVDENSTIDMEAGSKIEVNDGALLWVKNGSKVNMATTAQIVVNGTGKVLVEGNSSLVYAANAQIELNSPNAIIEVKANGKIDIAQNATFTWTGLGYLKINTPTRGVSNVVASGTNAKFAKRGGGAQYSQKLVEITGGGSLSVDKTVAEFKLELGHVIMGQNAVLDVDPIMVCHSVKFSTFNPNIKHGGIMVYGQQETPYLTSCVVEHAGWGFMAYNNLGTAKKATLRDCKFINNSLGVYINGKGADLSYCKFWQNTRGAIQLDMMTLGANITYTDAYENGNNGLLVTGTNYSLIQVNNSNIYLNNNNGIKATYTTLATGCSNIFNNFNFANGTGNNVLLDNNSNFAQDPTSWQHVGNNYFYNTVTDAIGTNNAKMLYLNKGNNHYQTTTGWEFYGTMRRKNGLTNRYQDVIANENYWNINGTAPINRNEYWVKYPLNNTVIDLKIIDATRLTNAPNFAACQTGGGSLPGDNNGDVLATFEGKPATNLGDGRSIQDAYRNGLIKMYSGNDNKGAIQQFSAIVLHPYSTTLNIIQEDGSYISEFTLWADVIDLSYQKMLEAFTRGFSSGEITQYPNDANVYSTIENSQLHLLSLMGTGVDYEYEWAFGLKLDHGLLYHVTNRNAQALDLLKTFRDTESHTSINLALLNFAICNIEKAVALGNGTISKIDLKLFMTSCNSELNNLNNINELTSNQPEPIDPPYSSNLGKRSLLPILQTPDNPQYAGGVSSTFLHLYPNPTNGVLHIATNANIQGIRVYDLLGKLVEHQQQGNTITINTTGIYMVVIKTDKQTYRKKIVVE